MSPMPLQPIVTREDARRALHRLMGRHATVIVRGDWMTGHKTITVKTPTGERYFGHGVKWVECYYAIKAKVLAELEYERDDVRASSVARGEG